MEEKIEIWKPVVGYEGFYSVSSLGRVRSEEKIVVYKDGRVFKYKSQIKSTRLNEKVGYLYVDLYVNRKQKTCRVHRLVAEAFLPNPDNLPQVNHKDCNRLNNNVENLEWCDAKYNANYGDRCEKYRKTRLGDRYSDEYFNRKEWTKNYNKTYSKEYYNKNKETILARQRERYCKNRDAILAKQRESYRKKKAG